MEQNKLPAFWDVAKAFKWAAEYRDEIGGELLLSNGQWLITPEDEDGNENEGKELTPGNVAELYCLQRGFEKEPVIDDYTALRAKCDKMEQAIKSVYSKGAANKETIRLVNEALEQEGGKEPTTPQQGDRCPECGAPCKIIEKTYQEEIHDVHYVEHQYAPQQGPVWVKASEQMSEHNVGVLVFIPGEDNHITSGMWDISNEWVLLDEYRVPECEVTHWMALPGLPEGIERNELPDEFVRELKKIARDELGLDEGGEKEVTNG
jgi:hypothetical protein